MDFTLSEEQTLIQDSFRGALQQFLDLDGIRDVGQTEEKTDEALWKNLVELGLPGVLIAEEYGGMGLGLLDAALISEELGRAGAAVPFTGSTILASLIISALGSKPQKEAWLPGLASGKKRVAVGVSVLSSNRKIENELVFKDGKLNGRSSFIMDFAGAAGYLVSDRNRNFYLVDAKSEGLSEEYFPSVDQTRSIGHLDLADVPAEPLNEGDHSQIDRALNAARVVLAADSMGASETLLEKAVDYSKERKQFDRVIGSFQAVKHMCAEMAADLQPCRALIWYAAYAYDHLPGEFDLNALLAKSHMDGVAQMIAKTATEVYGGMGFADLTGVHFWYKRANFNRATLGSPEFLRDEAARLQDL